MSVSTKRRPRTVLFRPSKSAGVRIVGPGLSAVRAACKPYGEQLAGLAPVFERIGQHLDTTVSQPGHDGFFSANRQRVIVVVSDVLWGELVLLTEVHGDEIRRALTANALPFSNEQLSDAMCLGWVKWSRYARRIFRRRRGAPVWNDTATAAVGGILYVRPGARAELAQIVTSGQTPIIAIALDSTGATRKRLKCSVRVIIFPLPDWARASGAVAGHA